MLSNLVAHSLWGSSYMGLVVALTENVSLPSGGTQSESTLYAWSTSIELFSWLEPSVSFSSGLSVLCKHVRIDGHQSFFFFSFLPSASSLVRKLWMRRKKCLLCFSFSALSFDLFSFSSWRRFIDHRKTFLMPYAWFSSDFCISNM